MRRLYFVGGYSDTISLGVYSNNLIHELKKTKKNYHIFDARRKVVGCGVFDQVKAYVFHLLKIYKEIENSENTIVIDIHNIGRFPPLFLGKNRIKRVLIVHDFFFYDKDFYINKHWFFKYIMYTYYNTFHKWLFKRTFRRVNIIVAISQATKNEIIAKFGTSFVDKIEVIHNGMDTSAFKSLQEKNKKTDQDQYLLYVGSELGRKNLKNIIAAFALVHKEFPNLKLIKAPCEGVAEYRKQTLQAIKETHLEVGKAVVFIDEYLPLEKLVELYQNAEIFLFPTLKEGFGFPIIEAQACGIPVITTNYEPMSELVPYKEMLVDPKNPQDIAEKIIKILKNPELKAQMIHDGLEYVKQFSWEKTAEKFDDVLKKL